PPGRPASDTRVHAAAGPRARCRLNTAERSQAKLAQAPREPAEEPVPAVPGPAARRRRAPGEASAAPPPRAALEQPPMLEEVGSLSYTALTELERCGYRFYLERILGLEENLLAAREREGD